MDSKKKQYVIFNDANVNAASSSKAAPDPEVKTQALEIVARFHFLVDSYMVESAGNSIDKWNNVSSIVATGFNRMRQGINACGGLRAKLPDGAEIPGTGKAAGPPTKRVKTAEEVDDPMGGEPSVQTTIVGTTYEKMNRDFITIMENVSKQKKVELQKSKIMGTTASILSLFTSFSQRMNEVMYPSMEVQVGMNNGTVKVMKLSQYGYTDGHQHLISGISMSPVQRLVQIQSLGPGTIMLGLITSPNSIYSKKWKSAFVKCFGLIDGAAELANELLGSRLPRSDLIHYVATAAALGLCRVGNKAYIPFALVNAVLGDKQNYSSALTYKFPASMMDSPYFKMDFSGKGLWRFLNAAAGKKVVIKGPKEMEEVVIHGMLGTHLNDLRVVSWMTGMDFKPRSAYPSFAKRSEMANKEITLPKFKFVFKLLSASASASGSSGKGQDFRLPVFAGRVHSKIGPQNSLFRILEEEGSKSAVSSATAVERFKAHITKVAERVKKAGFINLGTTPFYKNKDGEDPYGEEVDFPSTGDSLFFHGR
ncbi:CLUMA_CG011416, isoform A [Clunio marinus]|uniref:CLUMA_CG011416, isoform A n=1 Tax=Clunio marinus TaxID=568069 RepID=A0A1J1ICN5_9DIPT|nr:CLUMA_CG011416, isoform A [Clunio marinus]